MRVELLDSKVGYVDNRGSVFLEEANGGEFIGLELPWGGDNKGGGGVGGGEEESEGESEGGAEKEKGVGNGEFGEEGYYWKCRFWVWGAKEEEDGSLEMEGFGEVNGGWFGGV